VGILEWFLGLRSVSSILTFRRDFGRISDLLDYKKEVH